MGNVYGWSKKGKPIKKIIKNLKIRYTVISAISDKKVLLIKTIKGSANAVSFTDFIKELIPLITPQYSLLMDNARIHHSKIFKKYMETQLNEIIYNVPYSPEYNPIERVFSIIKPIIKKSNYTNNTIIKYIKKTFSMVKSIDLEKFYKKSLIFINE